MTGLETALAATGLKVLGKELIDWIKNRGDELSEDDWAQMGAVISRKLEVDYRNVNASFLHKSRKRTVVNRIESAAEIYRELSFLGRDSGFDEGLVEMYSELADICANWSIETDGLGSEMYEKRAREFFEGEEQYQGMVE